jgi:hypothetical protein
MVVVVGIVEKELSVGDAVIGGDGGVIDLGNADVEQSVAGANYERVRFADGVSESSARAEVGGFEGNFAGGRKERIRNQAGGGEGLEIPANAQVYS